MSATPTIDGFRSSGSSEDRPRPAPDRAPGRAPLRAAAFAAAWALASIPAAAGPSDLVLTKHNLSTTGPGTIKALTETRICVFCHTPHNSTPSSPLWNKAIDPQVYTVYTSATLRSGPLPQPSGPTKLCLTCHDGTIAMGAVVAPSEGIAMSGSDTLPPGSLSNLGLDLSGHHPVSFPYHAALPNDELQPTPPIDLVFGGDDEIHCTTCHDPHDDTNGMFLAKDNRFSALCVDCHQMTGWSTSAHATSTESVAGVLPRPPKTWPTYAELGEWGCETCHTPHFAATPEQLLQFTDDPPDPYSCTTAGCHTSDPPPIHTAGAAAAISAGKSGPGVPAARVDIARQTRKISAHRDDAGAVPSAVRRAGRGARGGIASVGCPDCHNPHLGTRRAAQAPYASGLLKGVRGVDRNGAEIAAVAYEYELCFKCHGDYTPDVAKVSRTVTTTNLRVAFDPSNPSYHPVVEMGKEPNVPSIPSNLRPALRPSDVLYCTSCHADDEGGSRGPHGSAYAPILKARYETADGTPESFESYALCYGCHERTSILSDASFKRKAGASRGGGHSGHLAAGAPCSACHDAHGIPQDADPATGSHTHLVNFDTQIARPRAGGRFPVFEDRGAFSGSCTLSCHGVDHDALTYP